MTIFYISGTTGLDDAEHALSSPAGPVLRFYGQYLKQVWADNCAGLFTTPYDVFYAKDMEHVYSDGRVEVGGDLCWEFFRMYYGEYKTCTQESLGWVITADEEKQRYEIWGQSVMKFTFKGDNTEYAVPRFFCYTIEPADAGKGTNGLQVRRLRDYYNEPLIYRSAYEKV